jgi:hypothetical protein
LLYCRANAKTLHSFLEKLHVTCGYFLRPINDYYLGRAPGETENGDDRKGLIVKNKKAGYEKFSSTGDFADDK